MRVALTTQNKIQNTKPKNPKTEQQKKNQITNSKNPSRGRSRRGTKAAHITCVRMCRALGLFCGATFMHSCTRSASGPTHCRRVCPEPTTDYRPETRDDYGKLHNLNTQGNNNNRNAAKYSSNCSYNNNSTTTGRQHVCHNQWHEMSLPKPIE